MTSSKILSDLKPTLTVALLTCFIMHILSTLEEEVSYCLHSSNGDSVRLGACPDLGTPFAGQAHMASETNHVHGAVLPYQIRATTLHDVGSLHLSHPPVFSVS
jgi:hypothetical protein